MDDEFFDDDGAELAASIARAKSLGRIIKDLQAMHGCNGGQRVVIGRQAKQVDRNDRAGPQVKPLCCRDRVLAACRIEVECLRLHVGENRRRAAKRDDLRGRAKRKVRANNRVAGPDSPRHQHQQQRVGTARAGDGMTSAAKRGEFLLERFDFRPLDELCVRQHASNCVVDGAPEPASLRGYIDKRDRTLGHARRLIHQVFAARLATYSAGDASRRLVLRHTRG